MGFQTRCNVPDAAMVISSLRRSAGPNLRMQPNPACSLVYKNLVDNQIDSQILACNNLVDSQTPSLMYNPILACNLVDNCLTGTSYLVIMSLLSSFE